MERSALLVPILLLAGTGSPIADARASDLPFVGGDVAAAVEPAATTVLEGRVLTPGGAPARGAVVATSAGGRAVADADGDFRLELRAPRSARSVQVTTAGPAGAGLAASRRVSLATPTGRVVLAPLVLAPEGACSPGWIPTFGSKPGTNHDVYVTASFDLGGGEALYAGGDFLVAGGGPASKVARWDGSRWWPLGDGVDGDVFALASYDDGGGPALYVGGVFTSAGGAPASRIARWDGAAWSPLGSGMDGIVRALCVFDDGSGAALYAAGNFTNAGGVAANRVARWDGSTWTALGSGTDDTVRALAVFDDGTGQALYAAGNFTAAGGGAASHLARWDGSAWTPLGGGADDNVWALSAFDDGSGAALYAAGAFTTAGGLAASRVARWDGSSWAPLGSGADALVRTLTAYDDGGGLALFAGGDFASAGGVAASHAARWDGLAWAPLDVGTSHRVRTLSTFDDGTGDRLVAGGDFLFAGGVRPSFVATWDGSTWAEVGDGIPFGVSALAVFDDGGGDDLYVGRGTWTPGVGVTHGVVRWDGSTWTPLGEVSAGGQIEALATYDDGTGEALYVGGSFTSIDGVSADNLARWDGTSWAPLAGSPNNVVTSMVVYDDGGGAALHVGGHFTAVGGLAYNHLAKWDGAGWSFVGTFAGVDGTDGPVYALEAFDDGSGEALYVGGNFPSVGNFSGPANNVAKWDGTSWSALGTGADSWVLSLGTFDDGGGTALYAGGYFGTAGGVSSPRVARWDGSSWAAVGGGVTATAVRAFAVFDDGTGAALHVGGDLQAAGGVAANGVARWDGSTWTPLGSGAVGAHASPGFVLDFAALDDGGGPALYVGGSFGAAPDTGDSYLAKWGCTGPEPPAAYCTGKTSSLGCVPFVSFVGAPSATSTSAFRLQANDVLPGEIGFVIYSFKKSNLDFHGGKLCVKAPITRLLPPKTPSATGAPPCTGVVKRDFNTAIQSGNDPLLTAGATVFTQWRLRDPSDPAGFGDSLTDGLRFTVAP